MVRIPLVPGQGQDQEVPAGHKDRCPGRVPGGPHRQGRRRSQLQARGHRGRDARDPRSGRLRPLHGHGVLHRGPVRQRRFRQGQGDVLQEPRALPEHIREVPVGARRRGPGEDAVQEQADRHPRRRRGRLRRCQRRPGPVRRDGPDRARGEGLQEAEPEDPPHADVLRQHLQLRVQEGAIAPIRGRPSTGPSARCLSRAPRTDGSRGCGPPSPRGPPPGRRTPLWSPRTPPRRPVPL